MYLKFNCIQSNRLWRKSKLLVLDYLIGYAFLFFFESFLDFLLALGSVLRVLELSLTIFIDAGYLIESVLIRIRAYKDPLAVC